MAIAESKRALERHLMALVPSLPTAFEGVSFDVPTSMYQRCQLRIGKPTDPVLGTGYYREVIQFQVFILGEANKGTTESIQRAEIVREQFKKGTTLLEGDFRIHILSTPTVGSVSPVGTRTITPVLIDVVTEVYS
jgi:hypothetical protein